VKVADDPAGALHRDLDDMPDVVKTIGALVDLGVLPILGGHQPQVVGGPTGRESIGEHGVDVPGAAPIGGQEYVADARGRDGDRARGLLIDEVVSVHRHTHHPAEA
jgi:hypothetical protein